MIKDLKKQIIKVLNDHPDTRNSDIALTIKIWETYYPQRLKFRKEDQKKYVALDDLFELPREDNIKRIRAKLQNEEGRFLPTSIEVVKQRKINEEEWRKQMLFNKARGRLLDVEI